MMDRKSYMRLHFVPLSLTSPLSWGLGHLRCLVIDIISGSPSIYKALTDVGELDIVMQENGICPTCMQVTNGP